MIICLRKHFRVFFLSMLVEEDYSHILCQSLLFTGISLSKEDERLFKVVLIYNYYVVSIRSVR